MALSSSVLSAAIRSALLADAANTGAVNGPALTALCDAIAGAVVTHITTAAVVLTTGTAAAQTGIVT